MANDEQLSPLRRLNLMKVDEEFYQRNTFDSHTAYQTLEDIISEHHLSDEHMQFVYALSKAFRGTHPKISAQISEVPDGTTPRGLSELKRIALTYSVAFLVDSQVAQGVKQESAISQVCEVYQISRRDVFRMLKSERARRIAMRDKLAPWDVWFGAHRSSRTVRPVSR